MKKTETIISVRCLRDIKLELLSLKTPGDHQLQHVEELIVERCYDQITDVDGAMLLTQENLKDCLHLVARLKIRRLSFRKVHFDPLMDLNFSRCSWLTTITFKRCDDIFAFILKALRTCPCLQIINVFSSIGVGLDSDRFWFTWLIKEVIVRLKNNYWLRSFTIDDLPVRLSWFATLMAQPRGMNKRQEMIDTFAQLNCLLARNLKGQRMCMSAVRQLFLIKKYRPDSLFRFINVDVVRFIAKLVYSSVETVVWYK